jgi:ABC-type lipoprotein export system ATPase subunit
LGNGWSINNGIPACSSRLRELPEIQSGQKQLSRIKGIRFTGVNVDFKGKKLFREPISFEVPSGEFFILEGPSGTGKTTLLHLLTRELDPSEGVIELKDGEKESDWTPIEEFTLESLRENMVLVAQESMFSPNWTVAQNVALEELTPDTCTEETKNRLEKALKKAQVPEKISERLWERLGTLSGGERKAVEIARTLFHTEGKTGSSFAFDESLANLDKEKWEQILSQFVELARDNIIVYVSHNKKTSPPQGRQFQLPGKEEE